MDAAWLYSLVYMTMLATDPERGISRLSVVVDTEPLRSYADDVMLKVKDSIRLRCFAA